jgi:hypothetical protein
MTVFEAGNRRGTKLTAAVVQEIRARYATGRVTQGALSRTYLVSIAQIGRIVRGEVWQSLPPAAPSDTIIEASARKMFALQESFNGTARLQREAADLGRGDRMLDELASPPPDAGYGEDGEPDGEGEV